MRHLLLILPVLPLLLAGCANNSPQAQAQSQAQTEAQTAANDDAKCRSYGLQPATPAFEKCLTKLADLRAQAEQNDKAELAGRLLNRPPSWGNF